VTWIAAKRSPSHGWPCRRRIWVGLRPKPPVGSFVGSNAAEPDRIEPNAEIRNSAL
jgi:hypothetical protein